MKSNKFSFAGGLVAGILVFTAYGFGTHSSKAETIEDVSLEVNRFQVLKTTRDDGKTFSILLDTRQGRTWRAGGDDTAGKNPLEWKIVTYNGDAPHYR